MSCLAPRPRTTVRREARFVLNSQVLDPTAQACAQPVGKSSCQGSSLSGHELLAVGTGGSQLQESQVPPCLATGSPLSPMPLPSPPPA